MYDMVYVGWNDGTSMYHYGIQGQKWGNRRYQNPDGSLTPEGRARYGVGQISMHNRNYVSNATRNATKGTKAYKANQAYDKAISDYYKSETLGKSVVKDFLLGTSGTMTYNMARASGAGRGEAWVRSWFDLNANRMFGGVVSGALSMVPGVNVAAGKLTEASLRNEGNEWSLQQRALRRQAVNRYKG